MSARRPAVPNGVVGEERPRKQRQVHTSRFTTPRKVGGYEDEESDDDYDGGGGAAGGNDFESAHAKLLRDDRKKGIRRRQIGSVLRLFGLSERVRAIVSHNYLVLVSYVD